MAEDVFDTDTIRYTLRVPRNLYAALKRVAEKEDRSVHAQMLRAMRRDNDVQQELQHEEPVNGN